MEQNSQHSFEQHIGKTYFSWIPTLASELVYGRFTKVIKFNNQDDILVKYSYQNDITTAIIDGIELHDTLDSSKKNNLLLYHFKLEMKKSDDNEYIIKNGIIQTTLKSIDHQTFFIQSSFSITKTGFIKFEIENINYKSEHPFQYSSIPSTIYTAIKLIIHEDAHHQQKVDDIVGVFKYNESSVKDSKIKILRNLTMYLKKIEKKVKLDIDNSKFNKKNPKYMRLLNICGRAHGFIAYISSYINKLKFTETFSAEEEKEITLYQNDSKAILDSINSFKQRLDNSSRANSLTTSLTTGIAVLFSSGILLSNLTNSLNYFDNISFSIFLSFILICGILAGSTIYINENIYEFSMKKSELFQQVKYGFAFRNKYKDEYNQNVNVVVKSTIFILSNINFILFLLFVLFTYIFISLAGLDPLIRIFYFFN